MMIVLRDLEHLSYEEIQAMLSEEASKTAR